MTLPRTITAFALLLWGCRFACAGEPVAFVLAGGNSQPIDAPGTVRWPSYVDLALQVGPNIRAAGVKRVLLHNPGGHFYLGWSPNPRDVHDPVVLDAAKKLGVDTRAMHVNQWLLAEQAGLRYADRDRLALGHHILRYYGVEEVIYYVGSPGVLRDAAKDGPACVEMFLACGKGASVGFDAVAWGESQWKPDDDICRFFAGIRATGAKVYVEPRLTKEEVDAGLGKWVDGTIATADFDLGPHFKPDLAIQPGETIRDMQAVMTLAAKGPEDVTPLWRGNLNWTGAVK